MIDWIKKRLANCEDFIKGVGIILYVLALIELVLGCLAVLYFAFIAERIAFIDEIFDFDIKIIARITIFFVGVIAVFATYIGSIFIANLIYSWGDKIEHTKKQTELLKIIAMK